MNIFVNINAPSNGNGSNEHPYKHINDAACVALAGDVICVEPGIYREFVCPRNSGTESSRIIYKSTKPLGAIITGAEPAKNWVKYKDSVWMLRVNNSIFGNYNPYTTYVYGDWYFAPRTQHTGAVYLNDRQLYEVGNLEDCLNAKTYESSWEPQYSIYQWYSEQVADETIIYANFHDVNPNTENVEINVRRNCFMPSVNGINYITVSGFNINKAATTWAPPAAYQDGMIGPHWAMGWIIEDCEISNSKCVGISLGRYYDAENDNYFTSNHTKSPTQMERDAVCRGQYYGWKKANVGHHIIRRCSIHHCEQAGIVGRMGCVFSTIEDNHIFSINNMQQLGGAEIAGIKLHAAIDVIIRRNHIHNSTMGIWLDWEAQGTRVTGNLFHDNSAPDNTPLALGAMTSQDLFIEVSHGPTLVDNNIFLSKVSVRISCEGIALVHNLISGALTGVGAGTDMVINGVIERRYTPYHIRHETEVAGFMTILHGDDRIYNNIFVQNWPAVDSEEKKDMGFSTIDNTIAGTSVFNGFPDYDEWIKPFNLDGEPNMFTMQEYHYKKLPVWINGNAYLNGAKPWDHEQYNYIDEDNHAFISLVKTDNQYSLSTNLYELISDYNTAIITSHTLGKAFEPDECFENPDGSAIVFDADYLGNHRGLSALPGPFVSSEAAHCIIWK